VKAGATQLSATDRQGIVAFLALTFLLAWLTEFTAIAQGVRFDRPDLRAANLLSAVMLIPAFCAWIVRVTVTKEGFATAGLRFGPWQYYVLVWIGVPWLFIVVYGVTILVGAGRFDPLLHNLANLLAQRAAQTHTPSPAASSVMTLTLAFSLSVGILANMVFTFGEEFGWTGFLLPKLLPLGRWTAALTYGVIWGLWHAPVVYAGYDYPGYPVAGIAMMCLASVAFGLIQTALRIRANSVVLTSFFHACINSQGRGPVLFLVFAVQPLTGGILGAVGIVVMAAIGVWLLASTPQDRIDAVLSPSPSRAGLA